MMPPFAKASSQTRCKVAIFDLDGTVLTIDSFKLFLSAYVLRNPRCWFRMPSIVLNLCLFFVLRSIDNSQLKSRVILSLFERQQKVQTDRFCKRFVEARLLPYLDGNVVAELQRYKDQGAITVLATASPSIYVYELARNLPIDVVISTEMELDGSNRWTGNLVHGNCYGPNKFIAVENWLGCQEGLSWADCAVYTDHHADLPLLQVAGFRYAVRPSKELQAHLDRLRIQVLPS